jgi:hypothetical protein
MDRRIIAVDPGRRNLALCMIDDARTIHGWAVLNVADTSAQALVSALDDLGFDDWLARAQVVVVERQPSKNPSMKMMQHYLEMLCTLKGVPATSIDPKLKLAAAQSTPWWPDRDIDSWTYAQRKKLAVETVTTMLARTEQPAEFVSVFAASKKKDDLADAFLTAVAYARSPVALAPRQVHVRRFKARKPTAKQLASGQFSQAGLKFLAKGLLKNYEAFVAGTESIAGFTKSCLRHFDSLQNAYIQLGGM